MGWSWVWVAVNTALSRSTWMEPKCDPRQATSRARLPPNEGRVPPPHMPQEEADCSGGLGVTGPPQGRAARKRVTHTLQGLTTGQVRSCDSL